MPTPLFTLASMPAVVTTAPPLSGSVPVGYVHLLLTYLRQQGMDAQTLLALLGSPPAPQAAAYPAQQWRAMLTLAATHLADPVLGLHAGATIQPAHLGPLGYVFLASDSLGLAAERYVRYQRLVHDVSPVSLVLDAQAAVLTWGGESATSGLLFNQWGLAALVQFARSITGQAVAPLQVDFVEPEPDDTQPYRDFFACPVGFCQAATRIHFSNASLALPSRQPDAALAALLEPQVQALLTVLPEPAAWVQEVRRVMVRHLLQGQGSLDGIAQGLNLSGRTLRRKLAAQGWHFRALLEDTRYQLAQEYLKDPRLTLPEVAFLLGYSEQSAFNRAYRRWTGGSPGQARR